MAKKKIFESDETATHEVNPTEPVENAKSEDETSSTEKPDVAVVLRVSTDLEKIPAQAVEYLKRHTEIDALYIDKFGGMFPKDTLKVFVKDATLYQNPYYKKKK